MPATNKTTSKVYVSLPKALATQVDKASATASLSTAAWVRQLIARELQYTGPLSSKPRQKYASPEARKAAYLAQAKLDRQLLRQLKAQQAQAKAAAP